MWSNLSMLSVTLGIVEGLYGRKRINFSNDFYYNKFHFGVFVNIASAIGLHLSSKLLIPWHSGICFLSAIGLNSIPAYYEGHLDMRNDSLEGTDTQIVRRLGFYSLITGMGIVYFKHKYFKF